MITIFFNYSSLLNMKICCKVYKWKLALSINWIFPIKRKVEINTERNQIKQFILLFLLLSMSMKLKSYGKVTKGVPKILTLCLWSSKYSIYIQFLRWSVHVWKHFSYSSKGRQSYTDKVQTQEHFVNPFPDRWNLRDQKEVARAKSGENRGGGGGVW